MNSLALSGRDNSALRSQLTTTPYLARIAIRERAAALYERPTIRSKETRSSSRNAI